MNYQTIVIGAGAGGLVVAIGLAKGGKKVLLIEKSHFGGDCTNFGCIPSKSLIASAEVCHHIRSAKEYGIDLSSPDFTSDAALERVRSIIAEIRSNEEPDALKKHGVDVLKATASFKDPHTIEAKISDTSVQDITAKNFVIAAGSHPFIPDTPGLKDSPFLTNETVFDLKQVPKSMTVLGGGPIGCELAQAFQRLGTQVKLIHTHDKILMREPNCVSVILQKQFEEEGMQLFLNQKPENISYNQNKFTIKLIDKSSSISQEIESDALLVSVGRRPNLQALNLDAAHIRYSEKGIDVDGYLRTSQEHIFAIGDIVGPPFFTHLAENHGRSVLTTLLMPSFLKRKRSLQAVPRVTYTDPEIASIGMLEQEAMEKYGKRKIATYTVSFKDVDRGITQGRTEGQIQVVTRKWSSKILGASILGPRAGEMLPEIALAMQAKIPLKKLANLIHAYPTYGQAVRKVADQWLVQTLLPWIKKVLHR